MTASKQTWKAWAAFDSGGTPFVVRFTRLNVKIGAQGIPGKIRPVTISLSKPKRQARKVK